MKRVTYQITPRASQLLDVIKDHYGHGSKQSALMGAIQHVYMSITSNAVSHGDTASIINTNHGENKTKTNPHDGPDDRVN